jgi:glycosyltransferase involved in cell wall biosynthesis
MYYAEREKPHILVGVTSPQTCLVLAERLEALNAAGFRVSLLSGPGSLPDQVIQAKAVRSYTIPMGRTISPLRDVVALWRMLLLLYRLKPDIVEFSTPKAGFLGSVAAWMCRTPVRVYFLRGLRLETVHGPKRYILLLAERLASCCAHVVVCNSASLLDRAKQLHIARPAKLTLLGDGSSNGVDVVRFSPGKSHIRKQLRIPADALVVGFVGRLTGDKGLPELIEAFALILHQRPDAFLLLVGWFDAAEDALGLKLRARVEGHPRVVLTGYVADSAPYYRAMDVLVLPSWREGFPNAVLEAAASGVPGIVTDCTGSRDAVRHEITGLLVPAGNPEAICASILQVVEDSELRSKMSVAARKWAIEQYDKRRVLALAVSFYRELLRSKPKLKFSGDHAEAATGLTVSL